MYMYCMYNVHVDMHVYICMCGWVDCILKMVLTDVQCAARLICVVASIISLVLFPPTLPSSLPPSGPFLPPSLFLFRKC